MGFTLMSQEKYGTLERSNPAYEITRNEFDGWPRSGLTRAVITEGFRLRCKCQLIHPRGVIMCKVTLHMRDITCMCLHVFK